MNDLLQYMFQDGFLSAAEVVALRKTCKDLHENPVRVLRSLNIARPEQIQDYIQRTYRIPVVTDKLIEALDDSFKALIPIDIALNYGVFAIAEEGNRLFVAMEDPSDHGLIHKLEFFLNRKVSPVSATVYQVAAALSRLYEVAPEQMKLSTQLETSRGVVGGTRAKPPSLPEGNAALPALESPQHADAIDESLPEDEEESIESLTTRALDTPTAEIVAAEDELAEMGVSTPVSADAMADALSLDEASLPAAPAASDEPMHDLNAGDLVFFDAPAADVPAEGLNGGGSGVLFDAATEAGKSPLPMEPKAGEVTFFDTPLEDDKGPESNRDLNPGEVIMFEDSPQLEAGDALFFDSSAVAAETTEVQDVLDLGADASKKAAGTSLAALGLSTISTKASAKPTADLNPGDGLLFDEGPEADSADSLSPGDSLLFDDAPAESQKSADLSPGDSLLFDDAPAESQKSADLSPGDSLLFDDAPAATAPETDVALDDLLLEEGGGEPSSKSHDNITDNALLETSASDLLEDDALLETSASDLLEDDALLETPAGDAIGATSHLEGSDAELLAEDSSPVVSADDELLGNEPSTSSSTENLVLEEATGEDLCEEMGTPAASNPVATPAAAHSAPGASPSPDKSPTGAKPPCDKRVLVTQANALLIKIAMAPSRTKAIETINGKLGAQGVSLRMDSQGAVTILCDGLPADAGVSEALAPLVKRLERLRV